MTLSHKNMNDFDKRQLILMLQTINNYKSDKVGISRVINNIGGLLNVLEDFDLNWKEKVRSYWFDLEIEYSVALSKGITNFDTESQNTIRNAIEEIAKLVESKLKLYNDAEFDDIEAQK